MKKMNSIKNSGYHTLLNDLKNRISTSRIRAALAVNAELIKLYWEIGQQILALQIAKGWGAKVSEKLSRDLNKAFPDMKGLSKTNLDYMLRFAETYPDLYDLYIGTQKPKIIEIKNRVEKKGVNAISPQAVGKIEKKAISPQAVGKIEKQRLAVSRIPWGHNRVLLEKLNKNDERIWYAENCIRHGWSRDVLVHQIESGLYNRQKRNTKHTNFKRLLPASHSELAEQSIKDPYVFDFLSIREKINERELEIKLMEHITNFLVELGTGFAFVGRQQKLQIGEDDFFIDLLFYHIRLKCYVVVELKIDKFKPEYAGQLNFYLSAVDDILKQEDDNPTIGILLCPTKNSAVVEYALKGIGKPMGVSEYRFHKRIPKIMQSEIESINELKEELVERIKKEGKRIGVK